MKKRMFMLFAGSLAVGAAGYFAFSGQWPRYVFAHAGGLGIMGLLGLAAATIAGRRGRDPRWVFWLAFALPVLLGILAVLIVDAAGGRGCGGIVSLAASFLVIAFYGLARNKDAGRPSP
jgi:hypothetical protein